MDPFFLVVTPTCHRSFKSYRIQKAPSVRNASPSFIPSQSFSTPKSENARLLRCHCRRSLCIHWYVEFLLHGSVKISNKCFIVAAVAPVSPVSSMLRRQITSAQCEDSCNGVTTSLTVGNLSMIGFLSQEPTLLPLISRLAGLTLSAFADQQLSMA